MSDLHQTLSALGRVVAAELPIGVQPEDQLKSPIKHIIEGSGSSIECFTEARIEVGRPDVVVRVRKAICGYVELKEPGKGANPERFRGADKEQWKRFQALPNLIYTDGFDWSLYRSGSLVTAVRGVIDAKGIPQEATSSRLEELLSDFYHWEPIAPTTPKALAETLAPLCRMLRDDVAEVMEDENSVLRGLNDEIRAALFPNASHRDFADTYAQTLTYALLLARLLGEKVLTAESAVKRLASGHKLLAEVLQHMSHPAARHEVATAVDVLERVIGAVDSERLSRRGDPWIYFYEHFLEAYDPKLRRDRGVYYTPAEVVQCQVRLADELLRTRFGRVKGYAETGVVFLDPAAGTAAYPLAVIQHALDEIEAAYGAGMVASSASELAKNIHAFEILVGPYAVAHLRISEALRAAGGQLPSEGLPVYLTDTLESPNAAAPSGGMFSQAMTAEHKRAVRIKRDVQILICMGNPPYDREQADDASNPTPTADRKGGWVRFGDVGAQKGHADKRVPTAGGSQSSDEALEEGILKDFLEPAKQAGHGVHLKNLYNDYVYFWRWALWKLFENANSKGPGIISFITASSYLRGPGFVGMRQKMREAFDDLWIIDLGGDNLGARRTVNVFNIQTPVAIAVGVCYSHPNPSQPARVHYTRLDADSREAKLALVGKISAFGELSWQDCFAGWMQPFLPHGKGDFYGWPLLTDIFPWQHSGAQFKRSWPIGETPDVLNARWRKLIRGDHNERRLWFKESRDRKIGGRYPPSPSSSDRTPVLHLEEGAAMPEVRRLAFRSLDRHWCLADNRLADYLRGSLWVTASSRQLFLTSLLSGVLGEGPALSVAAEVPDLHHFRGSFGGKDVIPLWRDMNATEPNVTSGMLDALSAAFGHEVTAEDLFAYTYTVMATPEYVERFSEELALPGPRLPLTSDPRLFAEAVAVGRSLINLHTYGERLVPGGARVGDVPSGEARLLKPISDAPAQYPESFSYDVSNETLRVGNGEIAPVSGAVWRFSISGLEVLKSWLGYRMKNRSGRRSSELDKIRPERWTAQMSRELLELIWVLENTVTQYPGMGKLLDQIIVGPLFSAEDLPKPSTHERSPPSAHEDESALPPAQAPLGLR